MKITRTVIAAFLALVMANPASAAVVTAGPAMYASTTSAGPVSAQVSTAEMIRYITDTAYNDNARLHEVETKYLETVTGISDPGRFTAAGKTHHYIGFIASKDEMTTLLSNLRLTGTVDAFRATKDGSVVVAFEDSEIPVNIADVAYLYDLMQTVKKDTAGMNDHDKIDYCLATTKRLIPVFNNDDHANVFVCNAIRLGNGRCGSMNQLLHLLLSAAGFRSQFVTGSTGRNANGHGWCRIDIGGNWYHMDAVGLVPNYTPESQIRSILNCNF